MSARLTTSTLSFLDGNLTATAVTGKLMFQGSTPSSTITLAGVSNPVADTDAATRVFVENLHRSHTVKAAVVAASDGPVTLATLTAGATVDGVPLLSGSRVLLKDQVNPTENGVFTITNAAPIRASDVPAGSTATGVTTLCLNGVSNELRYFVCLDPTGTLIGGNTHWSVLHPNMRDEFTFTNTQNATSTGTGAVRMAGGIGVAKDAYIGGDCYATHYNALSDARMKRDIHAIDPADASRVVQQLRPVNFIWTDTGVHGTGVLAQEAQRVEPTLVTSGLGDDLLRVDYNKITAYLLGETQSLASAVRRIQRTLDTLVGTTNAKRARRTLQGDLVSHRGEE